MVEKFNGVETRSFANAQAWLILADVRNAFDGAQKVKEWLEKYAAADPTDPFKLAVNAFYTPAELSDLGGLATLMTGLCDALAAEYPEAVGV